LRRAQPFSSCDNLRTEPVGDYAGIGGRALTSAIVSKEVPPLCHPLGENNKLVIAPGLLSGGGVRQYGDMVVAERYRLVDEGRGLEGEALITAPATFAAPWLRKFTWELDPNGMIYESICDPADSRF